MVCIFISSLTGTRDKDEEIQLFSFFPWFPRGEKNRKGWEGPHGQQALPSTAPLQVESTRIPGAPVCSLGVGS